MTLVISFGENAPPQLFIYKNYRGEVAHRSIRPLFQWYGTTEYHLEPGWLVRGIDTERNVERDFALVDMIPVDWTPENKAS